MSVSLGIDIGTSTVKVVLLDDNQLIIREHTQSHTATLQSDGVNHEQDIGRIFDAIEMCMHAIAPFTHVVAIAVCGQMHGCIRWKATSLNNTRSDINSSNLITWMDQRCSQQTIESLPRWNPHRMHSGYGCATLAWLQRNGQLDTDRFDQCGTVMDLFIAYLCELPHSIIGDQNAFSWGYVNDGCWKIDTDEEWPFPKCILPSIISSDSIAGHVRKSWCSIPLDIPVLASIGDLQATVYPHLKSSDDAVTSKTAVLNIGTSAQLCFDTRSLTITEQDQLLAQYPLLSIVPFFSGRNLIVAASLNGGNTLDLIVQTIINWAAQLNGNESTVPFDLTTIHTNIDRLLQNCDDRNSSTMADTSVTIDARLFGERSDPKARCNIKRLTSQCTLTQLLTAAIDGIIANIDSMLPTSLLEQYDVHRIVLCGQATGERYRRAIERRYSSRFSIINTNRSTAAFGAAVIAMQYAHNYM